MRLLLLIACFMVLLPFEAAEAQRWRYRLDDVKTGPQTPGDEFGFRFVRVKYDGVSYRRPAWATDYPTAEQNLYEAIRRTTRLHLEGPPIVLELTDERIFEYPFLYLTEPGYWETNDEEVEMMKKYFARGGFMLIDDFHDYTDPNQKGPEWENMYQNIKRVFPDREPVELGPDHPVWSIYYDLDPVAAISMKAETGEVPWLDPDSDRYYGIFDDDGRMMCLISYNQDMGDGWEWPGRNLQQASTVSFQMAINIIMYALTH